MTLDETAKSGKVECPPTLYSAFFDPEVCRKDGKPDPSGYKIAEELLKLQTIIGIRPQISLTLATDSHLFLTDKKYRPIGADMADNSDFLKLVREGYIRFPRWPDGKGPRAALKAQLEQVPLFSDWPTQLIQDKSLRKAAIRFLETSENTGDDEVDAMLGSAFRLFEAIEQAPDDGSQEADRSGVLKEKMERLIKKCGEESQITGSDNLEARAKEVLSKDIPKYFPAEKLGRRGEIFSWLAQYLPDQPDLLLVVRDLINRAYNDAMAAALPYESRHMAFRGIENPTPESESASYKRGDVEYH